MSELETRNTYLTELVEIRRAQLARLLEALFRPIAVDCKNLIPKTEIRSILSVNIMIFNLVPATGFGLDCVRIAGKCWSRSYAPLQNLLVEIYGDKANSLFTIANTGNIPVTCLAKSVKIYNVVEGAPANPQPTPEYPDVQRIDWVDDGCKYTYRDYTPLQNLMRSLQSTKDAAQVMPDIQAYDREQLVKHHKEEISRVYNIICTMFQDQLIKYAFELEDLRKRLAGSDQENRRLNHVNADLGAKVAYLQAQQASTQQASTQTNHFDYRFGR